MWSGVEPVWAQPPGNWTHSTLDYLYIPDPVHIHWEELYLLFREEWEEEKTLSVRRPHELVTLLLTLTNQWSSATE